MKVLDLFCGAGGASEGYARAGFQVVGVDIAPQPHYPYRFGKRDVLNLPPEFLAQFDLIHASPPCQHFSRYRNVVKDITDRYSDHLAATIELLTPFPHVIENVPGAPMRADVILCGSMFGLDVMRHRWFQTSFPIMSPACNHKGWERQFKSSSTRANLRYTIEVGSWDEPLDRQKAAMGIDRPITVRELSEAIPPAYTEYLGRQFLDQLEVAS